MRASPAPRCSTRSTRPETRIVSLTVSENGYCLDPRHANSSIPEHAVIRADLAEPEAPRSAIGVIVEAFDRRIARGTPPFTALTCDNIQHNGNVLRDAVLTFARLRDPALADRIAADTQLPEHDGRPHHAGHHAGRHRRARSAYGIADRWPVFCETFTQWVIEDRFVAGRPEWEKVGAQFVDDVTPYEMMKLRLLNGTHLAIAGLGRLAGYTYVHEVMANPLFPRFMAALMERELAPTLPPVPGIDLVQYQRTLIERYANPAIRDTVERINTDAPLNVLVVPIAARLEAGAPLDLLALSLAAWLRRARGEDEQGNPIEVRHPLAETLRARAAEGGSDPGPLLAIKPLFGETGTDPRLRDPVAKWLAALYEVGSLRTLQRAAAGARLLMAELRHQGKSVLITGGARGIGRAMAARFAAEGAWVAIADLNLAGARKAAAEIGSGVMAVEVDVREQELIDRMIAGVTEEFGGLDVLVNNAALFDLAPIVEITRESYHRVFSVNVEGALFTLQAAARQMIAQGRGGKIINMASQAGRRGEALVAVYCASKAAIISLTQSAGLDLIRHRINVNAIAPGVVDNEHWDDVDARFARAEGLTPGEKKRQVGAAVPFGRMARPEEIAGLASFLASAEADYIVAQTYNIDGGNWMS